MKPSKLLAKDPLRLAESQYKAGDFFGAIKTYEEYLAPGGSAMLQVLHNLVPLYLRARQPSKALAAAEAMTYFAPGLVKPWLALSDTRGRLGDWEGALRAVHQALEVDPTCKEAHQGRLFLLSTHGEAGYLREEARAWAGEYLDKITPFAPAPAYGHKKLRVGYVSADFRKHVMDRVIYPLLALHNRDLVEVYAYDNTQKADAMSAEMKALPGVTWAGIFGRSDGEVASLIRSDEIDILVDLSGITFGNRLEVFARRPAPVQVTWCGYLPTIGSEICFDWKFVDQAAGPQSHYTECLWRLPSVAAFGPLRGASSVSPLPAEKNGYITFGVTNGFHKVRSEAISAWVEILQRVPNSRLVLAMQGASEQETAVSALRRFGPVQDRVLFSEWQMGDAFPRVFDSVDIALDTFPYGGCATSFDTMWQGVPIVCLEGDRPNGRYAAHFMSSVDLSDFVAGTREQYVWNAVREANTPGRLASIRAQLRVRMSESPLFNVPDWVRSVELAYREMLP